MERGTELSKKSKMNNPDATRFARSSVYALEKVEAGLNCKQRCMPDVGEFDQGWRPQKMIACKMMRRTRLRLETKQMETTQMETKHICSLKPSNDTPDLRPTLYALAISEDAA